MMVEAVRQYGYPLGFVHKYLCPSSKANLDWKLWQKTKDNHLLMKAAKAAMTNHAVKKKIVNPSESKSKHIIYEGLILISKEWVIPTLRSAS